MDLTQLSYHKQYILDCKEAGLITGSVADRKLQHIKLIEESIVNRINTMQNETSDVSIQDELHPDNKIVNDIELDS